MKTIIAAVCVVAIAAAEFPPANSYLPPPPSNRGAGYPSGPGGQNLGASPQIVAARTLEGVHDAHGSHGAHGFAAHGTQAKGFGRSGAPDYGAGSQGRLNAGEPVDYDQNAGSLARNALEEVNAEPANYNFGYMVNDYQEGTDFGHHEERQEERAQGGYHVVLPDGRKQTVNYEADERGFKPQISYEETEDVSRSGYDSNAANIHSGHGDGHTNQGYSGDVVTARSNGYN